MAEVTVTDLIDEASYTADMSGIKAVRKFLVENLSEQAHKKLYEAALLPDVPQRATAHPSIPNLIVSSVNVFPVPSSPSKAWVVVNYESPTSTTTVPSESAPPEIEFGAVLQTIETSVDKDGKEMVLNHTQTSVDPDTQQVVTNELPPQPFKVTVQEASPYLTMSRREPLPFNKSKVINFVNRVNSVAWFGDPARTWLCAAIRARLDGDAAIVSYEFQYREKTWDVEGVYTDPSTGAPISGAVQDVGRKKFQVLGTADFAGLSLGV